MRKFSIPLAAAASTLAFAAPASAQWYPQRAPYGAPYATPYAAPYAQNNFALARSMEARVQNVRAQIRGLDQRNLLSRNQARSLDRQAATIQRQILRNARFGLDLRERSRFDRRIMRLEQRVQRQVAMNARFGNRYARSQRHRYRNRW